MKLDVDLFRLINGAGSNPLFDKIMPFLSGNAFFYPAIVILGLLLIWKGRSRGIICILMLALAVGLGDGWICRLIKEVIARPRPFLILSDVHVLIGKGGMYGNVIRMSPPLNISKADVDEAVRIIDESFAAVTNKVLAGASA